MSKRRVVLACACSTALLTACYFTTSFEGLSSGGPGSDGGGGSDATPTDGGGDAPIEGATDAGVDACAVPGLTTRLCDRFDRTDPRGSTWTSEATPNGGTIETMADSTKGGSRVFHARVPRLNAELAQAYLRFETKSDQRVHFEMDMKYAPAIVDNGRQLAILDFSGEGKVYVAMFVLTNVGMAFYEQVDPGLSTVKTKIHLLKVQVPPDAWRHVSLDLDFGPNKATILVDGTPALPADEVYDYLPQFIGTELTVTLGPSYSNTPSEALDAYFDNVVVASD